MKKVISIVIGGLFSFSCGYKDLSPCYQYHGKIIMTSCCTGSTFISIKSSEQIGRKTNLNGQDYSNVIQVPDYIMGTNIYLNLRKYNPDKDSALFPAHCYCLIAVGADVPLFVATAVSTITCPDQLGY